MGPGLLLLLLPWGALANVGGGAGACACSHRWPREPPPAVRLPPLAPHILRVELCPQHVRRFVLPHKRLCGLQDSPWVAELLQLWEHQVAQRALARTLATHSPPGGPRAADGPTDGPPDRPPDGRTDGPPDRPPDGPTDSPPDSPPANDGHLASPLAADSSPASPPAPLSPPAPRSPPPAPHLGEGHQAGAGGQLLGGQLPGGPLALPPTPAGWIHHQDVGQDPQTPPPAVGLPPLSMGLAMGLVLLGASLGLVGGLAWRGGCRGAGRARGPGPPPHPEALMPLAAP